MHNSINVIIGNNIKCIRKTLGLSQDDLGSILNITCQQISKYEIGEDSISAGKLLTLSQTLKVDISDFYRGSLDDTHITKLPVMDLKAAKAFAAIKNTTAKKNILSLMYIMH